MITSIKKIFPACKHPHSKRPGTSPGLLSASAVVPIRRCDRGRSVGDLVPFLVDGAVGDLAAEVTPLVDRLVEPAGLDRLPAERRPNEAGCVVDPQVRGDTPPVSEDPRLVADGHAGRQGRLLRDHAGRQSYGRGSGQDHGLHVSSFPRSGMLGLSAAVPPPAKFCRN